MRDEDVIKALECHLKDDITSCRECPLLGQTDCTYDMNKNALKLINRMITDLGNLNSVNQARLDTIHALQSKIHGENATEKPFIPHLEWCGDNAGKIGKETKYIDAVGHKLYVGDVVELFHEAGVSHGNAVIIETPCGYGDDDTIKQFVTGIACKCNDKNGSVSGGWKILLKRSYKDVNDGEVIDTVKFVTKEPKYYSGKLICVETRNPDYFTIGKKYECVDGVLNPNEGIMNIYFKNFKCLEDINELGSTFVELKK